MARLNEPTVSTDTLETLRRKFLRQNRDIARINSTQSLKIRNLENECARLLSENLQLRSETLRLKTELQGSHAHRVAEHALQIKEKMEAQLVEWGAMLAGLGHEPLPRNRSPRALKKPRIQRDSIGRSRVSDWRRRETMGSMEDLEAAALQEGRLPPLWENKTYPRETLSGDEILALCSEAEESTDSLELGSPPVSRFVDEDPAKLDLSTLSKLLKPAMSESDTSSPEDTSHKPASFPVPLPVSTTAQNTLEEKDKIEIATTTTSSSTTPGPDLNNQVLKANLKRKSREDDEKENAPLNKPPVLPGTAAKNQLSKTTIGKPKLSDRPIKELPTSKKDIRDKPSHAQRKPLSAKSSNEALSSPKKSAHAQVEGKKAKSKAAEKGDEPAKSHVRLSKEPAPIEIPPPSLPEAALPVDIEPESLSAEPTVTAPDSPELCAIREEMNDTPPPVDISSRGETTRANRRARAAVSYAEPNLRDKMRRPNTKQLFDAVTSENKNARRTSQCQRDEPPSATSSVAKSGARSGSSRKDFASQKISHDGCGDIDMMASPLAQKTTRTSTLEELPSTVSTHRKKKDSATTNQTNRDDEAPGSPISKAANRRLKEIAAREVEVAKMFDETDVYEFTESSPNDITKESAPEDKSRKAKGGRQSRSRRLSSIASDDLRFDGINVSEMATAKNTNFRKRASMAAIRSAKSDLEYLRDESPSVEGDSVSTADSEGTITREKPTNNRRRTAMM
ncbi:hypothetical protein F5B22DRAFT_76213 [Xylaria bambusicola]|uniref:uncharacterized protein n=1 Tax=Xylaria bambusicola TaxID=326684 RepID=UPI002007D574|nr:uncharacterized protein F5B22DRAFT_76213 [Xylaria bambusicola]KAI0518201.1 hypothetical protein F5B22DRAFT_76213 [Xylaria bambusicola]